MKVGVLGPNGFMGRYFLEHSKWIPITRDEVDLLDQKSVEIFFEKNSKQQLKFIEKIYERIFSNNSKFAVNYVDNTSSDNILDSSDKLVHFGWKKEAIPITQANKSIVARIFDTIFG